MSKERIPYSKHVIREFFAFSGNRCAYPNCNHPLLDNDGNYIAQICHIEGGGWPRHNPNLTLKERDNEMDAAAEYLKSRKTTPGILDMKAKCEDLASIFSYSWITVVLEGLFKVTSPAEPELPRSDRTSDYSTPHPYPSPSPVPSTDMSSHSTTAPG